MTKFLFLFFTSCLLVGCLFQTKREDDRPAVCGYVLDSESKKPIEGAIVSIKFCVSMERGLSYTDQITESTDSRGYFEIVSKYCKGNFSYEIMIEKPNYTTYLMYDTQFIAGFAKECYDGEYELEV